MLALNIVIYKTNDIDAVLIDVGLIGIHHMIQMFSTQRDIAIMLVRGNSNE